MSEQFSFGAWVRRRRKALDLTREELAPRLGCSVVTIRRIEADERRPSKQLAARLADCLEIAAEERAAFVKAARAELAVDQLATPAAPLERTVSGDVTESERVSVEAPLPSGTVTFLFTDIEGSTRLWERYSSAMPQALAHHDALVRAAIASNAGVLVKSTGDGVLAAFGRAPDALSAALAAQRALQAADWTSIGGLRVRMALHVGIAEWRAGDYFGPPLNRAARLLAAGHGGQVLLSLAAAELVREALPPEMTLRDLGEHHLKDLSRPERIYQLLAPVLPSAFPPLRSLSRERTNLPAQLTPLVGREREIAHVCDRLRRPDVRLVTLSGPGGIGKTRLALQAVAEMLDHFADGVSFVDLAPIRDPSLLIGTIAETLGVKEVASQALLESLKLFLSQKQLLLLLDNFEQIVEAAPVVAELLRATPALRVLVTSRTLLHLSAEHEFIVPPLRLPPQETRTKNQEPALVVPDSVDPSGARSRFSVLSRVEELTQYESVALFIERAQAVQAGFQVNNETAPAIAEICHQLDGLPLAIELAAARIKLFSPEELLARLNSRLPLLTGGPRDMPQRQQTLRATIEWSYQLLDQAEQLLFTRLAVFVGGWTLEAAEAVCTGEPITQWEVLDLLTQLVNKSLVTKEPHGNLSRYRMLETIREFAHEKLLEAERQTRDRHCRYYLEFLVRQEQRLKGPDQSAASTEIAAEIENVRAAWHWATEQAQAALIAQAAPSLWLFYEIGGRYHEGEAALGRAAAELEHAEGEDVATMERDLALGKVLAGQAAFWYVFGSYENARDQLNRSLAVFRRLNRPGEIGLALNFLAATVRLLGSYEEGQRLLEESIVCFRAAGDSWGAAYSLNDLGRIHCLRGRYGEARRLHEESLALFRQLGDQRGMGFALANLGMLAWELQAYAEAEHLFQQSLAIRRAIGNRRGIVTSLTYLGIVTRAAGAYDASRAYLLEALRTALDIGAMPLMLEALIELARLSALEGDRAQARALLASIVQHPASNDAWPKALQLMDELELPLPDRVIATASESESATTVERLAVALLHAHAVPQVAVSLEA